MSDRAGIPYDFAEARQAVARAAQGQVAQEEARRQAAKGLAESERTYRVALAKAILTVHAEGSAWTVAQDLARGLQHVADLRYARDVARGVLDASEQAAWRHTADRKDLTQLVSWSMRVAPNGEQREPA